MERTYNIPLRRDFMKAPRWKKSKKAMIALRTFVEKHMKSDDVKIGSHLNEHMWKHGIKNPPHHVKVTCVKDDNGVVRVELFGMKYEDFNIVDQAEEKPEPKKQDKKTKKEVKEEEKLQEKKEKPKEEKKTEAKKEEPNKSTTKVKKESKAKKVEEKKS